MELKYFRVRKFEEYQHYKDRNPPWIKLYRKLWGDPRFYNLTESNRYILISLFIVASQNDNLIPATQNWLKSELKTKRAVPLDLFLGDGWIEWCDPPDSKSASKSASTNASKPDSKSASSTLAPALAFARSRETETEAQRQKTETKLSPVNYSNTLDFVRPEEATGDRPKSKYSRQALENAWAPADRELRQNVDPDVFARLYAGCQILDFTGDHVVLAVPSALIEHFGGNVGDALMAKSFEAKRLLRDGRTFRIVPLEQVGEA